MSSLEQLIDITLALDTDMIAQLEEKKGLPRDAKSRMRHLNTIILSSQKLIRLIEQGTLTEEEAKNEIKTKIGQIEVMMPHLDMYLKQVQKEIEATLNASAAN